MSSASAGTMFFMALVLILLGVLAVAGILDFLLRLIGALLIVGGVAALVMGFMRMSSRRGRGASHF